MADKPTACGCGRGLSRRSFFTAVGVAAVGVAAGGRLNAQTPPVEEKPPDPAEMVKIRLHINGREHRLLVEPRWPLLYVLREKLELTGTKMGCDRGECGSCTVLIDGKPCYSCLTLAVEVQDAEITTLEGLMDGEELGDVQQAFAEEDAFQCGYCTPGQIMAAEGLLRQNPEPDLEEIRVGMSGNLCRCGAYEHIFRAVDKAAKGRKGSHDA